MLDIYSRDDYPNSYMINYDDNRQAKLFSWFNYKIQDNKRVDYVPVSNKDNLIKNLIEKEKRCLNDNE